MSEENKNQSPLLQVKDLQVAYGAIKAVKGVSFHVNAGEIVSLVGANGAGKSTILRCISGIVDAVSGQITMADRDLLKVAPHMRIREGLAHSPEGRGVFYHMSVLENLEMGAFIHSDKQAIKKDLEMCFTLFPRVKERLTQMAGTLSGGEQQMLAMCRALMSRPKLLLLDEPSLGLAPLIVAQIFAIMKELNSRGVSILLVEQNARMALKVSHRAYVLETGTISLTGTGQELLSNEDVQRAYLGH